MSISRPLLRRLGRGAAKGAAPGRAKEKKRNMSSTVLYMSMSLDGFVAGPNERPDNGLGDGGLRLHEWFSTGTPTDHAGVPGRPANVNGEIMDALMSTGAVLAGRG